jgi:hypothetical protein
MILALSVLECTMIPGLRSIISTMNVYSFGDTGDEQRSNFPRQFAFERGNDLSRIRFTSYLFLLISSKPCSPNTRMSLKSVPFDSPTVFSNTHEKGVRE